MAEVQQYVGTVRKQMQEGLTDTEEMRAIKEIRQKYKACYTEQMEKLHKEQAEEIMQGGAVPDDEQILSLIHIWLSPREVRCSTMALTMEEIFSTSLMSFPISGSTVLTCSL